METLPIEIVESILSSRRLSVEDILNFSASCHHWYDIVTNSKVIWKSKLVERWPLLKNAFEKKDFVFLEEIRYMYKLRQRTRAILVKMLRKFYKKYEIFDSDFKEWYDIMQERESSYDLLLADLMEIVNTHVPINSIKFVPIDMPGNKTFQYYASKVLRYIRQLHLCKIWNDFVSMPQDRQVLEIGAVFVAQWCQPNIDVSLEKVAAQLDVLAMKVREALQVVCPQHPLFKVSPYELALWRTENWASQRWDVFDSRILVTVLRKVFFEEMGFSGNNQSYYKPHNFFINIVLEKRQGLPITLAVIFEGVARRLGLKCEPISLSSRFLLRFCETEDSVIDWYYIDVFKGGQIIKKDSRPESSLTASWQFLAAATTTHVVERMAHNLEVSARQHAHPNGRISRLRSSLELQKLVNPTNTSTLVNLAKLYMLHNMDIKPLELFVLSQEFEVPEEAERILHMVKDYEAHHSLRDVRLFTEVEAAPRTPNLQFAVGMVMQHQTLNYKCVICDWDPMCLAAAEWQAQNNVWKLALRDDQPFYNVLVDDGSHRYVAQENLKPTSGMGSLELNEDVGRHFSHFFETHYVPNAEKEKEYPADRKVRHMFHQRKDRYIL